MPFASLPLTVAENVMYLPTITEHLILTNDEGLELYRTCLLDCLIDESRGLGHMLLEAPSRSDSQDLKVTQDSPPFIQPSLPFDAF